MATIRGLLNRRGKSKISKKIGMMGLIGAGVDTMTTYAMERAEGASTAEAAIKGVATGAAWLFAEPLMWGLTIAEGAGALGQMAVEQSRSIRRQYENVERQAYRDPMSGEMYGTLGGNFVDNEHAATLRQRQMSLLRQHRMATETILGSEARQLHR